MGTRILKSRLMDETFVAIKESNNLILELLKAYEQKKIPGITYGCNIDYYRDQFYKMIEKKRSHQIWEFQRILDNIIRINKNMNEYLKTGTWPK